MFCPSCGAEIPDGAAFCSKCGKHLGGSAPAPVSDVRPQAQQQPQQTVNVTVKKGNGLGVAGFVLALTGFVLCWIPVLGWVLWLLGLIFSFIGVFRAPRGLAIAGLVITFIDVIILLFVIGGLVGTVGLLAL